MQRLKIGIVGAGEITRKIHLPVLLSMPGVEVSWLFDQRGHQATALAKAYRVPSVAAASVEALPLCDVALLAIPLHARQEYLHLFATRGAAVLCEKPFSAGEAEHRRAIDAFPVHRLGVGYMRRFYRSTILLRTLVRERWLGPLRRITISEGDRSKGSGVDHSFLDDSRIGVARGVLTDLGSHTIDLALHISAAERYSVRSSELIADGIIDRKVYANVDLYGPYAPPDAPIELQYCVSWLDRQPNIIRLDFERSTVWAPTTPAASVFLGDPAIPGRCVPLGATTGAASANQAFFLEWRSFLDGVQEGTESMISARSALLTTSLVEELLSRERPSDA